MTKIAANQHHMGKKERAGGVSKQNPNSKQTNTPKNNNKRGSASTCKVFPSSNQRWETSLRTMNASKGERKREGKNPLPPAIFYFRIEIRSAEGEFFFFFFFFSSSRSNKQNRNRVHGVLHRFSKEHFARLVQTEGGGNSYAIVEREVEAYDGRVIKAKFFSASKISRIGKERPPSKRYLTLIREGAKTYGLDRDYVEFLERHPHNTRVNPVLKYSMIGIAVPLIALYIIKLGFITIWAQRLIFQIHDVILPESLRSTPMPDPVPRFKKLDRKPIPYVPNRAKEEEGSAAALQKEN